MLKLAQSQTTRREFLVRSAATAAGTFMSIGLPALGSSAAKAESAMSSFTPSIWFTLTPDGKVTMHIVKAEMGQHIGTGLAQVIAEELEVNWEDVRLDTPLESVENFAIYGLAYTVNSGSITTEFDRMSRAGAAGRMALIEAGAKVLGANAADCTAENSRVIDSVSGRSIGYGEIIQQGEDRPQVRLSGRFQGDQAQSSRGNYKIIGKSMPALDIPAKTNGQAKYGIDVFLPNMVYGALVIPRTRYALQSEEHRRFRGAQDPGFRQGREGGRQHGQVHRLGRRAGGEVPRRHEGRQGAEGRGRPRTVRRARPRTTCSPNSRRPRRTPDAGANWVLEGDVDKALAGRREGPGNGIHHRHGVPRHHGAAQRDGRSSSTVSGTSTAERKARRSRA